VQIQLLESGGDESYEGGSNNSLNALRGSAESKKKGSSFLALEIAKISLNALKKPTA
jgi:hypothetical protein